MWRRPSNFGRVVTDDTFCKIAAQLHANWLFVSFRLCLNLRSFFNMIGVASWWFYWAWVTQQSNVDNKVRYQHLTLTLAVSLTLSLATAEQSGKNSWARCSKGTSIWFVYDTVSDVVEIKGQWVSDFPSGSRVLKKGVMDLFISISMAYSVISCQKFGEKIILGRIRYEKAPQVVPAS